MKTEITTQPISQDNARDINSNQTNIIQVDAGNRRTDVTEQSGNCCSISYRKFNQDLNDNAAYTSFFYIGLTGCLIVTTGGGIMGLAIGQPIGGIAMLGVSLIFWAMIIFWGCREDQYCCWLPSGNSDNDYRKLC